MSGILKYFHNIIVKKPSSLGETDLPDPNGPLSKVIPSSTIVAANEKVSAISISISISIQIYKQKDKKLVIGCKPLFISISF